MNTNFLNAPSASHEAWETVPAHLMSVVVVAPWEAMQQSIAFALNGAAQWTLISDAADFETTIARIGPDVVVAAGSLGTRRFLDLLASHGLCGRTVFISDAGSLPQLTKQLSRGRSFSIVDVEDVPSVLLREIRGLAMPRSETRRAAVDMRLRFKLAGEEMQGEIVEISNKGCSVRIPALGGNAVVPGTPVNALSVVHGDETIIDEVSAVVRHVGHDSVTGGFRLGIEFVPCAKPANLRARESITDGPVHIAAVCDALLEGHIAISFATPGEDGDFLRATVDSLDRIGRTMLLSGLAERPLELGDVLQGVFEYEGTQHQFWTSVRGCREDALVVGIPKMLVSRRNRIVQRFRPSKADPVRVTAQSPLSGKRTKANALDLTASSVSFPISSKFDLFPVGTRVEGLELTFANGDSFRVNGKVRRLASTANVSDDPQLRCAVEFIENEKRPLGELAARIAMTSLPEVSTDTGATCDQIWKFLEDTGFLYPEKLARLNLPVVMNTMERLVGTPNEVAKTWLVRKDEKIVAHLSSVRLFSSTWGLQHLAALSHKSGASWASLLNLALAEYCEQHPKIEWLRIAFRPNNKWPYHVFGRFAHRVTDPHLSDFRTLSYMISPTKAGIRGASPGRYEVRDFDNSDLHALEACLVANGQAILLPSADISRQRIDLGEVSDSFDALGLTRRREILVADRGGKPAGFAFLEISSPGLNLSELTNATTIHCLEYSTELVRALGDAARRRYRELGYADCIALVDEKFADDLAAIGFVKLKEYCQWIWHHTLLRPFYRYVANKFP